MAGSNSEQSSPEVSEEVRESNMQQLLEIIEKAQRLDPPSGEDCTDDEEEPLEHNDYEQHDAGEQEETRDQVDTMKQSDLEHTDLGLDDETQEQDETHPQAATIEQNENPRPNETGDTESTTESALGMVGPDLEDQEEEDAMPSDEESADEGPSVEPVASRDDLLTAIDGWQRMIELLLKAGPTTGIQSVMDVLEDLSERMSTVVSQSGTRPRARTLSYDAVKLQNEELRQELQRLRENARAQRQNIRPINTFRLDSTLTDHMRNAIEKQAFEAYEEAVETLSGSPRPFSRQELEKLAAESQAKMEAEVRRRSSVDREWERIRDNAHDSDRAQPEEPDTPESNPHGTKLYSDMKTRFMEDPTHTHFPSWTEPGHIPIQTSQSIQGSEKTQTHGLSSSQAPGALPGQPPKSQAPRDEVEKIEETLSPDADAKPLSPQDELSSPKEEAQLSPGNEQTSPTDQTHLSPRNEQTSLMNELMTDEPTSAGLDVIPSFPGSPDIENTQPKDEQANKTSTTSTRGEFLARSTTNEQDLEGLGAMLYSIYSDAKRANRILKVEVMLIIALILLTLLASEVYVSCYQQRQIWYSANGLTRRYMLKTRADEVYGWGSWGVDASLFVGPGDVFRALRVCARSAGQVLSVFWEALSLNDG